MAPVAVAVAVTAPDHGDLDLDFTNLLGAADASQKDAWQAPVATATLPPTAPPDAPPQALTAAPMGAAILPPAPVIAASPAPIEPLDPVVEAGLQDAAVQFAEGDSAAAEAVLLGMLQADEVSATSADVLASALFDLYRATGQQDGFDVVAMDYAERFGRSPGEWFSLPELIGAGVPAQPSVSAPLMVLQQDAVWECPTVLGEAAVAVLTQRFACTSVPWYVDWSPLNEIESSAAGALSKLLSYWCANPVDLHLSGVEQLLRALENRTPEGDNRADPVWWRCRLDALCVLQRHDDFEGLALDYCVVYEVSPPSWKAPVCHFHQDLAPSGFGSLVDGPESVMGSEFSDDPAQYSRCELVGELVGDAPQALQHLQDASASAHHVVVSCALLIRSDFKVTDSILNWALICQSKNCHIQFVHVPRLVAVFFQMLGIDRYADILVRSN